MENRLLGNQDGEYYYSRSVKFEHHEVEYIPNATRVKLPYFLSYQHKEAFPAYMELYDHHGNMFRVRSVSRGENSYFTDGWNRLSDAYDLTEGGHVKMLLIRYDRILIQVKNRLLVDLDCRTPPMIYKLDEEPSLRGENDLKIEPLDHSMYLGHNPMSIFRLCKRLTSLDVSTICLQLPSDFCEYVYPDGQDVHVCIIDPYGNPYQGRLRNKSSYIDGQGMLEGWLPIMKKFNFLQRCPIRVEIPVNFTNHIFIDFHQ